ncbi:MULTISPECIES: TonB-dependent receptor plug domain-containing protein [unclassified Oceanispirochaeta]|uniref:TonB-dependent receptor plug domain-containing protein n=1 Tax=unclassified Oceanispirochaeta TaxID=2635722 RepID=UPI001313FE2C|nr:MULTISPECIES: TonB-dependent receptor plug domain-containing protein [unclassified Oceanispirochaeta]MBF9015082.1 TonB-dependent receptor plug domain-containing protein [Oceanispirochaeta sp. M2]NPD71540.1 TonB-dependent receptor plug domain-containing protein [Oceanispirochaeta sp. M1]
MKSRLMTLFMLFSQLTVLFSYDLIISVTDRDLEIPLEGALLQIPGLEGSVYTDFNGKGNIEIPDDMQRIVLTIVYPGYDSRRITLSPDQKSLDVELILNGIIEGEELVVERKIIGKSDEEVGVSVVMDKEEMDTTANIGIVEDVMSTIKTLPGVGYTSSWNARPSIRGGYPDEMAATLDGFYVTYPFHWGGAYSIFNPNMVDSAKLSNGVYSARYGRAMSGLLEITTITPDEPELRIDGALSTTSTDLFIQTPLGRQGGLLAGGKITYLDSIRLIYPEMTEQITTLPYIRDFYTKVFYKPGSSVELYMNGFYGSDGVGMDTVADRESYSTDIMFDYNYTNAFLSGGMDWSPGEKTHIELLGGYNWNIMDMEFYTSNSGTMYYSDEFLEKYGDLYGLSSGDAYTIDGLENRGISDTDSRQAQAKLNGEYLLGNSHIIAAGAETVFSKTSQSSDFQLWVTDDSAGNLSLKQMDIKTDVEDNKSLNTAGFLIWETGNEQSRLKTELGVRSEFYYIWNDDFKMNALPLVNPRGNMTYTAQKDGRYFDEINLSLGSGLFSYMPMTAELLEEEYGTSDWEMSPDRALFNVLGLEFLWNDIWKFKLEGYYKYYLNRLVLSSDEAEGETRYYYNTDGSGHAAGFDFMLQKKISRNWDGYLTYSFIWARFHNPSNTGSESESIQLSGGEPMDEWYFPYYHRFHNLNLVLNWRFQPGWTFSVIGQLASGAPRQEVGDVTTYPVEYDGRVIQQYGRTSSYSDTLRDGISAPVDLRIAYAYYPADSKIKWEWYVAVEDIFAQLYQPSANSSFNSVTGEENTDTSADFNVGIPIPSFGLKVSY